MKRLFKAAAVLGACACAAALGGCSLFGIGNDGGGSSSNAKYEFSVQYDDELTKYSFQNKDSISIDPRYKEGYVLDGFYTMEGGAGTKLLDWDGSCLSSSFSGDGSTVLYPNYREIDYDAEYKTAVWYEEDPKTASYNFYGDPNLMYKTVASADSEDLIYLRAVATANPAIKLKLTADAEFKGSSGTFSVGIGKDVKASNLLESYSYEGSSSYTSVSVSAVITGKALTIDGTNIFAGVYCNVFNRDIYYKNVQITISIVHPDDAETDV